MKKIILLTISLIWGSSLYGDTKFIDLSNGNTVDIETIAAEGDIFVMGETHYNRPIQTAQAAFLSEVVQLREAQKNFDLGWEFLNVDQYEFVNAAYKDFANNKMSTGQFLQKLLGEYEGNISYEVILEELKRLEGGLIPLNLSRPIKRQVVKGGITALDPQYLPKDFQLGGNLYYERFIEAMGGHGGPSLDNYFAAQSLVDNVMADTLESYRQFPLSFLICGSFHSDFFDGVVAELYRRSQAAVVSIRFLDVTNMTEDQVQNTLFDQSYGEIADFAVLVSGSQN